MRKNREVYASSFYCLSITIDLQFALLKAFEAEEVSWQHG